MIAKRNALAHLQCPDNDFENIHLLDVYSSCTRYIPYFIRVPLVFPDVARRLRFYFCMFLKIGAIGRGVISGRSRRHDRRGER